ncbi:hypothetical protein D9M70_597320 [compost metagenome]
MPGAAGDPLRGRSRRQLQEHHAESGHRAAQALAIAALEGGAGEHRLPAGSDRLAQLVAQGIQPAGAVLVVQRDAGAHLANVFRGVECIAFDDAGAALPADRLGDAGLAATGDAHDHECIDGGKHRVPLGRDSAIFEG